MPEWIEHVSSQTISTSQGRGAAKRVFFASGYANAYDLLGSFGQTVGSVKVPKKGDSFPNLRGTIARDFTATQVDGHTDLWRIEWQYEVVERTFAVQPSFPVATAYPAEVGYVEESADVAVEFVDGYRLEASIPGDDASAPEVADIGGTPIDVGLSPTSIQRRRQTITLTETVNVPRIADYAEAAFNRNSAAFLGAAPGRVLYRGASIRRTGLYVYQVSHTFIDDEWKHLEQQPIIDQNGVPIDADSDGHADTVYHIQPFPNTYDFGSLSSNF